MANLDTFIETDASVINVNLPVLENPQWILSPVAAWMAEPFPELASKILTSKELEAAFIGRSWAHRHALMAVFDNCTSLDGQELKLASDFLAMKPAQLVRTWCSVGSDGLDRVFEIIAADRTTQTGAYKALIEILNQNGQGAHMLRHAKNLTFVQIRRLHCLPDWLRSVDWRDLGRTSISEVYRTVAMVKLCIHSKIMQKNEIISLAKRKSFIDFGLDLDCRIKRWDYPSPPWPGSDQLQAISSYQDLKIAASEFNNCCLNPYEQHYYYQVPPAIYVWRGQERAMVKLERISERFWACTDIKGINNGPVSILTEEKIMRALPPLVQINAQYSRVLDQTDNT